MNNIQRRRVTLLHGSYMSCDGLDQDFGRDSTSCETEFQLLASTLELFLEGSAIPPEPDRSS